MDPQSAPPLTGPIPLRRRVTTVGVAGLAASGLVLAGTLAGPAGAQDPGDSAAFAYTGQPAALVVPADVHCIGVTAVGGAGGAGGGLEDLEGGTGGRAALVEGDVQVTPGGTLTVFVGGAGQDGVTASPPVPGSVPAADGGSGGIGGPARGGDGGAGVWAGGGGGGAASWVFVDSTPLAVAAGGGGGGAAGSGGDGADGGHAGQPGRSGAEPADATFLQGTGGGAGTDATGGAPGSYLAGDTSLLDQAPSAGQAFAGGDGGSSGDGAGGGGGGVFGGGGGYPGSDASGSGGGGGASLLPAVDGSERVSPESGDGRVVLTWVEDDRSCVPQPFEPPSPTTPLAQPATAAPAARPAAATPRFTG